MDDRIVYILLFAISMVHSKTFYCSGSNCLITGVTAEDSPVLTSSYYETTNITILNSKMDDMPTLSKFSRLYYLNCVGCGLTDITKHSFSQLISLKSLDISYGSYQKLQKKLFSQAPALTYLNMNHGAIGEIDDTAFSDLALLVTLDLSFNKIENITSNMFIPLVSLRFINLSNNHINCLNEGLFMNNTNLENVYLLHNHISEIYGVIISPKHILKNLDLSYNELTTFDTVTINAKNVWTDNNRLKRLTISDDVLSLNSNQNSIESVSCGRSGNKISSLYLVNNSLTELGCIGSLSKLTYLDLSYNNFGKLNQSSFSALTELKSLNLKSANIGKLDYGVFSHQKELEQLDISYNHIGNIALEMFLAAKGLSQLYMDGNNITEFSYSDLKMAFTNIQKIGIGDNDFNCTFLAQAIKQLNSYDIETIVSTGDKVTNSHNINGIGCHVKKEKATPSWIPRNENVTDHTINNELDVKVDAIIQQVETLSDAKRESDKTFVKMSDDISAIKQLFNKMNSDILSNKAEILKFELTKVNNGTNSSNIMLWTLVNQLNNITLEKQQVSNRAQIQEANELKFEIEKNRYKLSDVAARMEKIEEKMVKDGSTRSTNQSNDSNTDYAVIRNMNIILITLFVAFCVYKGYKFIKNDLPRIRRYNTANTLHTNIEMDNNSARQ